VETPPTEEPQAAPVEAVCPRCGTPRLPGQEYCLDCGLHLPATAGAVPALRRRWIRRLGWYPGDWVWTALMSLVIAVVGALAAIQFTTDGESNTGTVFTKPYVPLSNPTTTVSATIGTETLPPAPEPTSPARTTPPPPPNGKTPWPSRNGWTVVLESLPAKGGQGPAAEKARSAATSGLPEVGVLDSSQYSSLHPGYLVVFSGVYDTKAEADSASRTAHSRGFGGAYSRPITR